MLFVTPSIAGASVTVILDYSKHNLIFSLDKMGMLGWDPFKPGLFDVVNSSKIAVSIRTVRNV